MQVEITRRDEQIYLRSSILENVIFQNDTLTFSQIISCLKNATLSLEVSEDKGTKILDNSSIEEIKRVIPFLMKIADKPRSFIQTLEEKVPVETAKRINHKAISKLSRDSSDWYARTVLSVKPKNVVSDINEETIDLYENRFICALIDRITKLLSQARQYYESQIQKYEETVAQREMEKEYVYSTNSFPLYNTIRKQNRDFLRDDSFANKLKDELESILQIEKRIHSLKRSDFYRLLRKKRKVVDPIQRTNILMFEFNYNQAYKLWKYLNEKHQEDTIKSQLEIPEEESQETYQFYSCLCLMGVFSDMGFEEVGGGTVSYRENKFVFSKPLIFERGDDRLELHICEEGLKCRLLLDEKKKKYDEFIFFADFINFEVLSRSKIEEKTKELLSSHLPTEHLTSVSSVYSLVSIHLARCSEDNEFTEKVYRRFFSIGDNLSPEEGENIRKWGNYRAGIVILTPTNLRNNFLKLERIINFHILQKKVARGGLSACPICGGRIIAEDSENYSCHYCYHRISYTYCNECDKEHKKPILWVRYINDHFLKNETIVRNLDSAKPYYKMGKIEMIMGEYATTSFQLELDVDKWKMKTLCPRCGIKLGTK